MTSASPTFDVLVVGGGAAGLNAALVLGRARRRVAVVDAGAPRNAPAARMQGFLSRDGMPPAELLAMGRAEVAGYGVELIEEQVVGIEAGFSVRLAGGRVLLARRILLATGVRDELPEIPGVRDRWGRDLLHCPYCHGWEVRDQPLGVLGTAPGSVQHALLVRQWSDDVVFFAHTLEVSLDEVGQAPGTGHPGGTRGGCAARGRGRSVDGRRADGRAGGPASRPCSSGPQTSPMQTACWPGWVATSTRWASPSSTPRAGPAPRASGPRATSWTRAPPSSPRPATGSTAAMAINADLVDDDVEQSATDQGGVVSRS